MRSKQLLLVMLVALSLLLNSCMKMDSFLYNTKELQSYTLSHAIIPDSAVEELNCVSEGNTLYGFYVHSNGKHSDLTVLYCHGNKESIDPYWERVELLYQAGFNVYIFDYRGFGKSQGSSSESSLATDARAALAALKAHTHVADSSLAIYGFSLGGVPAIDLAANVIQPRVLITESIFASGETLVQSGTLLDIPGSFLLKGEYPNSTRIRSVHTPLLMLHGDSDTFIDIDKSGRAIYAQANDPKHFIPVPGANHTDVPMRYGTAKYISLIEDFVVKRR